MAAKCMNCGSPAIVHHEPGIHVILCRAHWRQVIAYLFPERFHG